MQILFTPVLVFHIAAGFTALLTGLIAIISKKGKSIHCLNGKIYFWSMLFVAVSAIIMSLIKDLHFFLMISMFSFYAAYTGFRAIRNKERRASATDLLMLALAVFFCLFMVVSKDITLTVFELSSAHFFSVTYKNSALHRSPFKAKTGC